MKISNFRIPIVLKFVALLLLLSVGPLIFVGIRTVHINRVALQTSILELHTELARSFSEKISEYFNTVNNEIPYITQILTIQDLSWEQQQTMLKKVLQAGKDEAATVSKDLLALVDRTARKGIMHKNKASRIKSRIQKRLAPAKA